MPLDLVKGFADSLR